MRAATLALWLTLAGCAAPPQFAFLAPEESARVWPRRDLTGEVPRYRLVGELIGEPNFKRGEAGALKRALRWLAGADERDQPTVLQRPQSGMVDARGRVIVTDVSRAALLVFDLAAGRLDVWSAAGGDERFLAPIAVAAGRDGETLVTDAELARVVRLDADGRPLGAIGAGVLKRPTGIARDAARGEIYVADTHAHDIKVFADDGRLLRTLGRHGALAGEFNFPTHLAFANDELHVADAMNARVQVLDRAGQPWRTFGTRGLYVGNFVHPKGLAVDGDGNVYVVESFYDHLLVFDRDGRFLMAIGGTGKGVGQFYLPAGVWTDANNRVYVADMFNGRVVVFQFLGGDP